jgi:hypothetical protein
VPEAGLGVVEEEVGGLEWVETVVAGKVVKVVANLGQEAREEEDTGA